MPDVVRRATRTADLAFMAGVELAPENSRSFRISAANALEAAVETTVSRETASAVSPVPTSLGPTAVWLRN